MKLPTKTQTWTESCSGLGTGPVPIAANISPEYFEKEREAVFRNSWLNVGRVEDVPRPGDYFVKDLAILNSSVLVVRGKDEEIRAFHNVCKHRGNRLATGSGSAKQFTCGFHGWTYALDGQLAFVPDQNQFFSLDRSACGLTPIAAQLWQGFIFICPQPRPAESLEEWLGKLGRELSWFPFGEMGQIAAYSAEVRANWKLVMAIFQECYHVPTVHNTSVSDAGCGPENPLCHLLEVRFFPRHRSGSVYLNPEHRPTPSEALAFRHGMSLILSSGEALPKAVNPARHPNWVFDFNGIFPNFLLDLSHGSFWTYHFWPLAVNRTLWELRFYMRPATNAGEQISQEFNKVLLRETVREDLAPHEPVQANLASGAVTHFIFSEQEAAIRHSYKVVDDLVRGGSGNA